MKELAEMLRCRVHELLRVLRDRGLLSRVSVGRGRGQAWWTSARGVQVAIVYVRARQGDRMQRGKYRLRCAPSAH